MLVTIVVFLITLLVLVISHELGHFLVAKKFGVKVLEFGFGLPPKIWSKRFGGTQFSINWLPIGGFVRLLGEDEADQSVRNDPHSFASRPALERLVIVAAGVTVNLILSWTLFYIVLLFQDWRIVYPSLEPVVVVAGLTEGFPAQEAGVKVGEKLLMVNDTKIQSLDVAVRLIRGQANQRVKLTLADLEGGSQRTVEVTPREIEGGEGRVGAAFTSVPFKQYTTLAERLSSAPLYSWDLTKLTLHGLGRLISDLTVGNYQRASQSVAGPVGLVGVTGEIVSGGWQATIPYLWFMGVISLTLTIFNSLPFPALDGGRALFMLVELVTKKKVNPEIERLIHTAGMAILLALMVLITISDIRKLFL